MITNGRETLIRVRSLTQSINGLARLTVDGVAWCIDSTVSLVMHLMANDFVLMAATLILLIIFLHR
jgi:hypothetical protein